MPTALQRLSIDVAADVGQAVKLYRGPEFLNGDNQYMCPTCSRKVDAERRVVITALPSVLNIQVRKTVWHVAFLVLFSRDLGVFARTCDLCSFVCAGF